MISTQTILFRLLLACLCGGVIGFERTRRLKEAGIRTHCIISSASALLMLISQYGFTVLTEGTRGADAARIAAQVVSGISFLGAGVIFKNGSSVKGLTTAAGIWATAGVGLAIGCGMLLPGIFLTLLVLVIQFVFHRFGIGNDAYAETDVRIVARDGRSFKSEFIDGRCGGSIQILSIKVDRTESGAEYAITFRPKAEYSAADIDTLLARYPEIQSFSMTCCISGSKTNK